MAHILLVDDDYDVLELLTDTLISVGHLVTTTVNGLQAYQSFSQGSFDLAIVDVEMPEMNGLEFTAKVREEAPDFPVILITGYSHLYRPEDVLSLDVEAFLKKPLNLPDLIKIVDRILEHRKNEE